MAPKKEQVKLSAKDFLNDESYGQPTVGKSWADEMDDMPTGPSHSGSGGGYGSRRDYGDQDRGYGSSFRDRGGREDRFPPRQPLPLPEKPPYTAHVGNLSWDTAEGDIEAHFSECGVINVRLVRDKLEDRPKGFGYVEFSALEGLVKALDLSGSQMAGRPVRVSVAEPPKDRGDDRFQGEWRRTGPLSPLEPPARSGRGDRFHSDRSESGDRPERRHGYEGAGDGRVRDFNNWERKGPLAPLSPTPSVDGSVHGSAYGGPREMRRRSPADGPPRREFRERPPPTDRQPTAAEQDNQWRRHARPDAPPSRERSIPTSPVIPHTRPRLELKKRSEAPVEIPPATSETPSVQKPNPFGAAKPIDAEARIREVEARRAQLKKEQEEREKKEAEERKAKEEAERLAKAEQAEAAKKAEAERAEAEKAEKAEAEKAEKAEKSEKPEKTEKSDRFERPPRTERTYAPREPREHREREHREYQHRDREHRDNRDYRDNRDHREGGPREFGYRNGPRYDRPGRGGGGAGGPLPARDWSTVRRGPATGPSSRRESRDDAKGEEASTKQANKSEVADLAKVEPTAAVLAEEGWSTVPAKKGRGGSKAAMAS